MNRHHMRQREIAELWVALLILGSVATLAYRSVAGAADTLGWVEHANQVIQQIGDVSSSYARTVTARRAYVVAGDTSQLAEVPDLDARMARAVATLRLSINDNPAQLARLDTFGKLLDQRVRDLSDSVAKRQHGERGVETAEGIALASRIRTVREEMETEENRLLAERDAHTRRDLDRTKLAEVVGTLASFAILLFAFGRLRQEIALRQRSEIALRTSEGFLDSIVENIPDMIFVKEAGELRFERINRAGEDLLAIARKDLIRKNDFDFFPREQAEAFQARDRETLARRVVVDIPEEPIKTKDGERWLHTKKVPVVDADGTPRYLLGISEDITERRREAAALKAAKDAAVAANQELEAFSYSVAHDLRAPLRAIDGFSQALEEDCADKLDAAGVDYLKRVRSSAQHMGQLIDGLLGLSRLTRGAVASEKLDLSKLARESGERLREAYPERPVELIVKDGLAADGDLRLLTAVFDNLLGNAWKFTGKREHPRVEVGTKIEDGRPVFFVRDNGAGFDPTYAHKLFGTFQRLHGASEFEGSGIGLATVQRIIRRHGGRVWAEGEVDRGATLYFTL